MERKENVHNASTGELKKSRQLICKDHKLREAQPACDCFVVETQSIITLLLECTLLSSLLECTLPFPPSSPSPSSPYPYSLPGSMMLYYIRCLCGYEPSPDTRSLFSST